jgi:WD40 repeat protein
MHARNMYHTTEMCVCAVALQTIDALALYKGHTAAVEDVAVHGFNPHILGSVGDDGQLILWDTRKPPHQSTHTVAWQYMLQQQATWIHGTDTCTIATSQSKQHLIHQTVAATWQLLPCATNNNIIWHLQSHYILSPGSRSPST